MKPRATTSKTQREPAMRSNKVQAKLSLKHKLWKQVVAEEFALGIDPKSLHTTVLMQMVYNTIIWHSGQFLKHMAISELEKGKIMVA